MKIKIEFTEDFGSIKKGHVSPMMNPYYAQEFIDQGVAKKVIEKKRETRKPTNVELKEEKIVVKTKESKVPKKAKGITRKNLR